MTVNEFFEALNAGATWSAGVAFKRSNPLPLDRYSVFESKAQADEYASTNPVAYPGQVIAVVSETEKSKVYFINDKMELEEIGIIPVGEEGAIEVAEDGKITLHGFATAQDEYLPRAKIGPDGKRTLEWVPISSVVEGDTNTQTFGDSKSIDTEKDEKLDKYTASLHGFAAAQAEQVPAKDAEGNLKWVTPVDYTVHLKAAETAEGDNATTYVLSQGAGEGTEIGKINIPKELVVKSGSVKSVEEENVPYEGAKVGDKYIELVIQNQDTPLYIPAKDLVDIYTPVLGATEVQIAIDGSNRVSASLVKGGVKKSYLEENVQSSLNKANSALQAADLAEYQKTTDADKKYVAQEGYIAYSDEEKQKLAGIADNAQVNVIEHVKLGDKEISITSEKTIVIDAYNKGEIDTKYDTLNTKAEKGIINAAAAQGAAETAQSKADANELAIKAMQEVDRTQTEKISNLEKEITGTGGSEVGLKKRISDLETTATTHTQEISNINTSLTPTGSVGQKIAQNTSNIIDINNKLAPEGTIGKAIAQNTTDIADLKSADTTLQQNINNVAANVENKANSADVYTKKEIGGTYSESSTLTDKIQADKSELQGNINGKADKAKTLAGYGIEDAYTKAGVETVIDQKITAAPHLKRKIVASLEALQALSTEDGGKDINTVYMIKDTTATDPNDDHYKEYMYIDETYVLVGTSKVDLKDYVKSADLSVLEAKVTTNTNDITANKLESITINGHVGNFAENKVSIDLPAASVELGLVKASKNTDKISLDSSSVMSVNKINASKLVQEDGIELVLDGGLANGDSSIAE